MTCLVLFCGHAGSSKTTLAQRLRGLLTRIIDEAFYLLDKDTLSGRYRAALIEGYWPRSP